MGQTAPANFLKDMNTLNENGYRPIRLTGIRQNGQDILSRTPEAALTRYLDAEKNKRYSLIYLLTPITERQEDYDEFVSETEKIRPF